jgi:hypothetical protein
MAGLPDGIYFLNQKSKFRYILGGLGMENRYWSIFGYLMHFTAIWHVLWKFGIFSGNLVYFVVIWYFLPFWFVAQNKSGNPVSRNGLGRKVKIWRRHFFTQKKRISPFFIFLLLRFSGASGYYFKLWVSPLEQGCQISLGTIYQSGEKYTK